MKAILLVFIIVVVSSCALRPHSTTTPVPPPHLPKAIWTKEDKIKMLPFVIGFFAVIFLINPNYPY